MAVNQNHSADRREALIPHGESVLKKSPDVDFSFPQSPPGSNFFSGTKRGVLFLTSYRVIFVTSRSLNDPMLSFMMPFHLMSNCTVEQPILGANYIKGTIQAAPDGGWEGSATFKMIFRKGGAIDFAQLMAKAAYAVAYGVPPTGYGAPPPGYYVLPPGYGARGYGAPPPVYGATPMGYGVLPPGYEAPTMDYGVPPPRYGVPPPRYEVPPPRYETTTVGSGSPPPSYEAPPMSYETSPSGHRFIPPISSASPAAHEAPPARSEASHPTSVAAQTPRFQASFPSTSSSQAHSPSSKM
ncbi:postacrosomal sheath WW domain-binding protein isoform X3 [Peromyscus maniculatus bairdii]|uniref:postacrosomal sheath WW domain-binding protein isoform X3 n=1 Tax=Peromyscus maniculatus bairdii TaxID=230844 RepID=UPI001C2F004A|nr:postacrosomal sheath WW domain-binding protein isoform X3 [Peromyscus maniculatus bairdii]